LGTEKGGWKTRNRLKIGERGRETRNRDVRQETVWETRNREEIGNRVWETTNREVRQETEDGRQ
jgi:hypothetical protein